jgi:hypothetical protein
MIKFARHRPTWMYTPPRNGNHISDFPLVPEPHTWVRPPVPPAPIDPAYLNPPPVPERPCPPQQCTRVELVRKYDPAPPDPVADRPPAEPTPQPAAAISDPAPQPVSDTPPPKPKKKYKKRPRRERPLTPDEEFALVQKGVSVPITHHERLCLVCRNPLREAIEEEFIHWHSVRDIAETYQIPPHTLYRHARAVNLYDKRDRNLRFALGHIIQRAQDVRITADSVVRAVHHFARINRDGQWVNPPTHVIVSPGSGIEAPPSDPLPADPIDVILTGDELPAQLVTPGE